MDEAERARVRAEVVVSGLDADDFGAISELITGMDHSSSEELSIRDKSVDYYTWMYLANPVGKAVVMGARHHGRLVASFAIAPKLLHLGGKERIVGKTMDMFTDPSYQGLGLMSLCARATFDEATARGISTFFVTPSPNSYPIFLQKFHFREEFEVQYRAKMVDPGRLISGMVRPLGAGRSLGAMASGIDRLTSRGRQFSLPPGFAVEESTTFAESEEQLWREVAPDYGVATVRSASYLNWRYVENPDDYRVLKLWSHQRLAGFVVLKHTMRRGIPVGEIVDYVCDRGDDGVFRLLVGASVKALRERGAALVEAWVIPGTTQERRFRRAGLRFRRATNKFVLSPDAPVAEFYSKEAWLLTLGDGNDV